MNMPSIPSVGFAGGWDDVSLPSVTDDEPVDLSAGDRVVHAKFGTGTVLEVQGAGGDAFVTVDFESAGKKSIMLNYAKLEKV
jgi:DNA helicase-2/ATP-dependent DNA helicase PcrA